MNSVADVSDEVHRRKELHQKNMINLKMDTLTEPELMEQTNTFPISILHISIDLMTHKGIY